MKRILETALLIGVFMGLSGVSLAHAEESPKATPAASATFAEPKTATTTEGSITTLDISSTAPSLKLADSTGKVWKVTLDPRATSIWDGDRMAPKGTQGFALLRSGQRVKVAHVMQQDGTEIARSVQIVPAVKAAPAVSSTPMKKSY